MAVVQISRIQIRRGKGTNGIPQLAGGGSEEHTSELQSRLHLVCRLLLDQNNEQGASVIRIYGG